MSELEEKLSSILSSPKDMEKIMGLAKQLSGSLGGGDGDGEKAPQRSQEGLGLDPKMLSMMSRLMGEYRSGGDDKTQLVNSLKPYLKEERRGDLDRAVKIARLAHLAKIALREFGGDLDI